MIKRPILQSLLVLLLTSCLGLKQTVTPTVIDTQPEFTPTLTLTPTFTATLTPTGTATQPSVTMEPDGCLKPVDDYTRVEVNGQTLNQRTLSMLVHAQEIYAGEIEISGHAITQGSYTDSVSASFGTHAGGGAVDLSVLRRGTYTVLWDDVEPLIRALRLAGFAA